MLQFLEFTFQSFWHWLGVLLLLTCPIGALGHAIARVVRAPSPEPKENAKADLARLAAWPTRPEAAPE